MKNHSKGLLCAYAFLSLVALCGCGNQVDDGSGGSPASASGGANVGSLEGTAVFSNASDSSGITVSIEKSDGLLTASTRSVLSGDVSRARDAVAARNSATVGVNADGAFMIESVEPGTYTVEASSPVSGKKAVQTGVLVEAGKRASVAAMTLTAVGSISGSVKLDGAASGSMGFLVFVAGTSYMAVTDDAGSFTIGDVPANSDYTVVVSKNGFMLVWGKASVTAGATADMGTKAISSGDLNAANSYLVWKGSLSVAPSSPQANWAYFNVVDKKTYVYNGVSWVTLSYLSGFAKVTFETNGAPSLSPICTDTVGSDLLTFAYSGHALVGWYASADFAESSKVAFPYAPTSDVTLYARWVPATDGLSYAKSGSTPGLAVYPGTAALNGLVIIPDYWQGVPVTEIPDNCFSSKTLTGTITYPSGLIRIGKSAFSGCTFRTTRDLPSTLRTIGPQAFRSAVIQSTSFILPSGLTSIGVGAFWGCRVDAAYITIPDTVTDFPLAVGVFSDCGILSLTIPSTITEFPPSMCLKSLSLKEVRVNATTPPKFGDRSFDECTWLAAIKVPAGSVDAYKTATGWSAFKDIIGPQ